VVDGLAGSVLVEAVHALSLPESVLLARELPNLAALIDARPPLPVGLTAEAAQGLAARVLAVVEGHPKLIELAEGTPLSQKGWRRGWRKRTRPGWSGGLGWSRFWPVRIPR